MSRPASFTFIVFKKKSVLLLELPEITVFSINCRLSLLQQVLQNIQNIIWLTPASNISNIFIFLFFFCKYAHSRWQTLISLSFQAYR